MRIDFTPTKLKEAKEYVNLLQGPKIQEDFYRQKLEEKESTFKRILNFLFK